MLPDGSENGFYFGNISLNSFCNPLTYEAANHPVPQTSKKTALHVLQTYAVPNHSIPQTYAVPNHSIPQTYKLADRPVPETYIGTKYPVQRILKLKNPPVPQTCKVANYRVPHIFKLKTPPVPQTCKGINRSVLQSYKVTNQLVPQTYKPTNHPVIIRCCAEKQVLNTSSVPFIKHQGNDKVMKVVTYQKIVKQEENLPVNVMNASDIKKEKVNSNEKDIPNDNIPEVDIIINNVVSSFKVKCHLDLRHIARIGLNVEYRPDKGAVLMKMRKPQATAWIRSSGNVTCIGTTSEKDVKTASRKIARKLQKLGFGVRFCDYRIVNVMCTSSLDFGINLIKFAQKHKGFVVYEPELHPGATYRIKDPKATLTIFTTGSINVTAPSIRNAQLAIEYIYPLLEEFKTTKPSSKIKVEQQLLAADTNILGKRKREKYFW